MNRRRDTKLVREGHYAAEVEVELIETDDDWSPYLSLDDARKLDDVREALRREDIAAVLPGVPSAGGSPVAERQPDLQREPRDR